MLFFLAALCDLSSATVPAPREVSGSTAVWLGDQDLKPPLKVHQFNITLRNRSSEPRWMVLPNTFGQDFPNEESELHFFFNSKPPVLLVEGLQFLAIKLPGHGIARLGSVPIESWWEDNPPKVAIDVRSVRTITLDGVAIEKLVQKSALNEKDFEVTWPQDVSDHRLFESWHPKGQYDYTTAKLHMSVESVSRIRVNLKH